MPRQTTEPLQWAHTHIWATTFCRNCGLLQSLSGPGTSIILPLTSLDFPYRETEMFPLQIAPASALEENVRCTCSEKWELPPSSGGMTQTSGHWVRLQRSDTNVLGSQAGMSNLNYRNSGAKIKRVQSRMPTFIFIDKNFNQTKLCIFFYV